MKQYLVTIHLVIEADGPAECCDWVSETLRGQEGLADWAYAQFTGTHHYADPYHSPELRHTVTCDSLSTRRRIVE